MKKLVFPIPWQPVTVLTLVLLGVLLVACGNQLGQTNREVEDIAPTRAVSAALDRANDSNSLRPSEPTPVADSTESSIPYQTESPISLQQGNQTDSITAGSDSDAKKIPSISPEQLLAAFEEVLNGIYVSSLPSVVYIRVPAAGASVFQDLPAIPDDLLWGAGSGFVWDDKGHIVTNHHVVETAIGETDRVTVIFSDASQVKGTVIGSDPHSDLAVIRLEEGDWNLHPANLGDSSNVKVGHLTVAIGTPFGQEFTMTSGIVSGVGRNISGQGQFTIPEVIQTDSAINPGNSGGPLLDKAGQVIGINTQIISQTGNFSGVGMAVPVNIAKRVIPPLIEDGEFNYPWLGVSIATLEDSYSEELGLPDDTRGALIVSVVVDSPADAAGLLGSDSTVEIDGIDFPLGGDIIVGIGSHRISGSSELIAHLTYHNYPGDIVSLVILRDGQRQEIEVTLGERPQNPR